MATAPDVVNQSVLPSGAALATNCAAAGAVVNDDSLVEFFAQLLTHGARQYVGRATGREGDDEPHDIDLRHGDMALG